MNISWLRASRYILRRSLSVSLNSSVKYSSPVCVHKVLLQSNKKVHANMAEFSTSVSKSNKENEVKENDPITKDGELLQTLIDIVKKEKLYTKTDESKKIVDFKHPEELGRLLDLSITREGCLGKSDEVLQSIVTHSVRTQHPHFYNQQYGGIDEVGLTAAWLLEALNTNQHTYEVAPALVMVERAMLQQLLTLFGFGKGDGIFCPGGSLSNMYSIFLAKHRYNPDLKKTGMYNSKPFAIFTSDQCHYSISKSAFFLGFGLDSVVTVETDRNGVMTGAALRQAVNSAKQQGKVPLYVNATAGSTVFGCFDAYNEIADVCQEENMWFHVDGCWGGALMLSKMHKKILSGVERADSLSWNPHKMLCIPLQCSAFIVKHEGLLHEANCIGATYLFQQDKFYDVSYDTGDKSVQCGRKGDALKLWLFMKLHGLDEIERRIDEAMNASRYLEAEVKKREGFELVRENLPITNVCFWYIPPCMRTLPRTDEWWSQLHKVAPTIKQRQMMQGKLLIGYQPLSNKGLVNFFRHINTSHPTPTTAHMDFVLDHIEECGRDLTLQELGG